MGSNINGSQSNSKQVEKPLQNKAYVVDLKTQRNYLLVHSVLVELGSGG